MRFALPLALAALAAAPVAAPAAAQGRTLATLPNAGFAYDLTLHPSEQAPGQREIRIRSGEDYDLVLPATFSPSTRFSGFRIRQHVISWQAQDGRYTTQYRWGLEDCRLSWTATDRRTRRVSRGSRSGPCG